MCVLMIGVANIDQPLHCSIKLVAYCVCVLVVPILVCVYVCVCVCAALI